MNTDKGINLEIALRRIFEIAEWLDLRALVLDKSSDAETLPKLRAELAELKSRLAPAPEEPKTSAHIDKCIGNVTMDEWYGGFSKIESTEPINPTCDNTTHKFGHCDCKEPASEWRELVPDEERVNGQFTFDKPAYSDKCRICGEEYGFHMGGRGDEAFCRRTRRPLPVQEEMPLEDLQAFIDGAEQQAKLVKEGASSLAFACLIDSIRYLRDEIQKLKEDSEIHESAGQNIINRIVKLEQK